MFQLSVDCGKRLCTSQVTARRLALSKVIILQRLYYGNAAPPATLEEGDDLEQEALALSEE